MLNFWIWLIFILQFDSDKNDIDIRDVGKKVTKMETKMEEILEQLQASTSKMEQLDAEYKDKEEDVPVWMMKMSWFLTGSPSLTVVSLLLNLSRTT